MFRITLSFVLLAMLTAGPVQAQGLADRVDALETRADETDVEQAAQDVRLDDLDLEQAVQDVRLDDLDLGQVAQDVRLDGLDLGQVAQDLRLDDLDLEQVAQDLRLDGLELQADETDVEQALDGSRLTTLEGRPIPGVLRSNVGDFIGLAFGDAVVLISNGHFSTFQADRAGLISGALNTYNFETVDCSGQAFVNIAGVFDSQSLSQLLLPQDSNGDGFADFVGFADGPETPIVINSRLISSGTCISVPGAAVAVSPMFFLDLSQFPTPWRVGN